MQTGYIGNVLICLPNHEMLSCEEPVKPKRPKKAAIERARAKSLLTQALRVPRGKKKLFVVEAAIEVQSRAELESAIDGIKRVLCPVPPQVNHRCARRWMVITHPADESEAASWEPILNDR